MEEKLNIEEQLKEELKYIHLSWKKELEEVKVNKDGDYSCWVRNGFFTLFKKDMGDVVPKVGDIVQLITTAKNMGGVIRGLVLNDNIVFCKKNKELEAERQKQLREWQQKWDTYVSPEHKACFAQAQKAEVERQEQVSKWQQQVNSNYEAYLTHAEQNFRSLHPVLRQRMESLCDDAAGNRKILEPHYMRVCLLAMDIANKFKDLKAISTLMQQDYSEQVKQLPSCPADFGKSDIDLSCNYAKMVHRARIRDRERMTQRVR